MLPEITKHLEHLLKTNQNTEFIINNTNYKYDQNHFELLKKENTPNQNRTESPTLIFIDGGSAIIASAATFSLSFIRIVAVEFKQLKKTNEEKYEFYLLTTPTFKSARNNEHENIIYESIIFPLPQKTLIPLQIDSAHLKIPWNHPSIKNGVANGQPSKIIDITRRFAELTLAAKVGTNSPTPNQKYQQKIIIIDGAIDAIYPNEQHYLEKLAQSTCAIAKSSSLLTTTGNSPNYVLLKNGPQEPWIYSLSDKNHFVKLHRSSKHILRFQGKKEYAANLLEHASDAIFPGYPYGLIYTDRIARISTEEKKRLTLRFCSDKNTKQIRELLGIQDAHSILDNIG